MKTSKTKILLILLIILIEVIIFSAGTYAGYVLSAKDITYTKADGTTVSVEEALNELNEKIPEGATVTATTATTHTAKAITYSWDDLASIAQSISNNSSITNDTAEVKVKLNGAENTIGVGDTITLDSKTVRILGFNHDELASSTAYGAATATGKAGISFEYVTILTSAQMNSSDTNSGGWGSCALRSTLNGTTYSGLSIKDKIKQVKKEYIQTYDSASSKTTSSDYLWLLSCGEIWSSGYNGGVTRGYAIATEGSQYKYYKLGNPTYDSSTDYTKKPNTSSANNWWLRSPLYSSSRNFCFVNASGYCDGSHASSSDGVAPGFSI